jgi:hypothetical protein
VTERTIEFLLRLTKMRLSEAERKLTAPPSRLDPYGQTYWARELERCKQAIRELRGASGAKSDDPEAKQPEPAIPGAGDR